LVALSLLFFAVCGSLAFVMPAGIATGISTLGGVVFGSFIFTKWIEAEE